MFFADRLLVMWVALIGLAMVMGCRQPSAAPNRPRSTDGAAVATGVDGTDGVLSQERDLCNGRPRCKMVRARVVAGDLRVVDLLIRLQPDAGQDDCSSREYWRIDPGEPPRLLAIDCDVQRSAEGPAAATTEVVAGGFVVEYVEFQASDQCERYHARLDVKTLALKSEERWEGTSDASGCHTTKRLKKLAPKGDGARDRPILHLHADWGDVNGRGDVR